ncbi:TerC family protein [Candidatus Pantoea edessiphila]|uniref:CBS domain-containing protein n=1 Tax=Candidatus Pantoea edessiphila TaxID=2044610 RepID=A0A2P5SWS2_9GAMM|nr:CBS domain-containing protein [Candidatus Pantoea edessiphila]PPI86766.1 hypothetical protein CRV10_00725 [Candidatus Pantoea edessiphila]
MEIIFDPSIWIGLITLVALEIVLGVDNLIFISILTENLPKQQSDKARLIGLSLALIVRLFLIVLIFWFVKVDKLLWTFNNFSISGRNLIFFIGGVFLVFKATFELYKKFKSNQNIISHRKVQRSFSFIIIQIILLDVIFSLDAIITAAGMINNLALMIISVIIATVIMFIASKSLNNFISFHPNIAVLFLSFLLIIGLSLITESFNFCIPKSYLYSIIVFSVLIEIFNQISNRNIKDDSNNQNADYVLSEIIKSKNLTQELYIIKNLLLLYSKSIRSIMTLRDEIFWIDSTESIDNIRTQILKKPYNLFPVCCKNLDKIIGIVSAKDLLIKLSSEINIANFACQQPVTFALDNINLFQLLDIINKSKNNIIIVINDMGVIQGLITPFDILKNIANSAKYNDNSI